MIGATVCIWRFHVREERRRVAQAQRAREGVLWVRQKIRRALVLSQDISELRLADSTWSAREAARDRQLVRSHARSLAFTASAGARRTQHVSSRMLCACFREFSPDNWRLKATGTELFKTVHDRPVPTPTPVPSAQHTPEEELRTLQDVEHQVVRQFYAWDTPQAGESDWERVKRVRELLDSAKREKQAATETA